VAARATCALEASCNAGTDPPPPLLLCVKRNKIQRIEQDRRAFQSFFSSSKQELYFLAREGITISYYRLGNTYGRLPQPHGLQFLSPDFSVRYCTRDFTFDDRFNCVLLNL
jgi:hypothetical protein